MQLVFLGTDGYHPNERRHTASVLLPDIGVALDTGTGFFRVQNRIRVSTLDVFLTHSHLDHICGLTYIPDELDDLAEETGHSSSSNVARLAKISDVKRLYIVHVDPQRTDDDPVALDGIHSIFSNTELAEDLMEIEF